MPHQIGSQHCVVHSLCFFTTVTDKKGTRNICTQSGIAGTKIDQQRIPCFKLIVSTGSSMRARRIITGRNNGPKLKFLATTNQHLLFQNALDFSFADTGPHLLQRITQRLL